MTAEKVFGVIGMGVVFVLIIWGAAMVGSLAQSLVNALIF